MKYLVDWHDIEPQVDIGASNTPAETGALLRTVLGLHDHIRSVISLQPNTISLSKQSIISIDAI